MSLEHRVPPHDLDAEAALIGSAMTDSACLDTEHVRLVLPTDFYSQRFGEVWQSILKLRDNAEPVDLVTVSSTLTTLGSQMTMSELVGITEIHSIASYADYYAKIVLEKSRLRQLIRLCGETIAEAHDYELDSVQIVSAAERKLTKLFVSSDLGTHSSFVDDAAGIIKGRAGVATGLADLDAATGGLVKGALNVLCGRPSMGKTSTARGFVRHQIKLGNHVAYLSIDQTGGSVMALEASRVARKSLSALNDPNCTLATRQAVTDALHGTIAPLWREHVTLVDRPMSVIEWRSICRQTARNHSNLSLIVVDHILQLVQGDDTVRELGQISRMLNQIARELGVPVLALSQLSRKVEARPNKRPMLSDLRESGNIEEEAYLVIGVYRDEYYNPQKLESKGLAELSILKHKSGPTKTIKALWRGEFAEIVGLVKEPKDKDKEQ